MLATHNHHSVLKAYRLLQQTPSSVRRSDRIISFAQLYGMGDDITYGLVKEARNSAHSSAFSLAIVKYIPYGSLNEVLPYLIRRAEENRGMLGGSMLEREALYDEVKRRVLATLGIGSTTAI
jgi:proline dehydrogenase